ncbi:MAG: nucleoside-diphosphate kinase [Candidatus Diapherotrites archaeon]
MQRSLIIFKPDAVNRGLAGRMLARFEDKGLKIIAIKMEKLNPYKLKEHYAHHKEKDFYEELIKFMTSIPSILVVVEGKEVCAVVRKMIGSTLGREAEPGTIRGDFSVSNQANLIHASENVDVAEEEIERFFEKNEIHSYQKMDFDWVYAKKEKGYLESKDK